jgi:hypothetical protein
VSFEKRLGKITSVRFGRGGYQDAMMGLTLSFGGEGWGVFTTLGDVWDPATTKWTEMCRWTEVDRDRHLAVMCREISKLLKDAKVDDVAKLKDRPVECTFDGSMLKDFRILTEVL